MSIMKRFALMITGFILAVAVSGCKSEDEKNNPCGLVGGITVSNSYVFWADQNRGQLTVEVKDSKGTLMRSRYTSVITVYYPNALPEMNCLDLQKENGNVIFNLQPGQTYTYRAYNDTYSYTGTIGLSCEQNFCYHVNVTEGK